MTLVGRTNLKGMFSKILRRREFCFVSGKKSPSSSSAALTPEERELAVSGESCLSRPDPMAAMTMAGERRNLNLEQQTTTLQQQPTT
jgi:hypothetical protein